MTLMEFINQDVETCCCCCELRTGNIVLGTMNAIFSGLILIVLLALSEGNYDEETGETTTYTFGVIFLTLVCLFKFLFDVLFIYGVVKSQAYIVRMYYIMYLVFMAFWSLVAVTYLFSGDLFAVIGVLLAHVLSDAYLYVVCRSYYRQLLKREEV